MGSCSECFAWLLRRDRPAKEYISDIAVFNEVSNRLGRSASAEGAQLDLSLMRLNYDPRRPFKNEYSLLRQLGAGSFGTVYSVRHKNSKSTRAMKMLDKKTDVKEDMAFVITEIEAMVRLDHPNVSKFYQFYEDSKCIYIISELCTGGDFSKLQADSQPEAELQVLFQDVFRGVAYCHDQGIAHRDLKFENCLLTAGHTRQIGKVIDFGLSSIKPESASELYMNDSLGTKFFVAPEVIKRKNYGVKCDVWSLGIMVYIVLTGEHPFAENAPNMRTEQLFQKIVSAKLRIRPLDKSCARPAAVSLLKSILLKDPQERIDATTALKQPWLNIESTDNTVSGFARKPTQKMINRMKTFQEMSRFEKTVLMMAAHQTETSKMEDLRTVFTTMDTYADGSLTISELKAGLAKCNLRLSDAELTRVFNSVDTNQSGKISYHEWLSATMAPGRLELDAAIQELFSFFDSDRSGNVTTAELGEVVGEGEAQRVLQESDTSGDGTLDYDEFKAVIHKIAAHRHQQEEEDK